MGADLAFKGLITLFHSELAFLKAQDSSNICLTSGSDAILFKAEVNLCKKKSVKATFGPCIILVNGSVLFSYSSTLFQAFKAAPKHRTNV